MVSFFSVSVCFTELPPFVIFNNNGLQNLFKNNCYYILKTHRVSIYNKIITKYSTGRKKWTVSGWKWLEKSSARTPNGENGMLYSSQKRTERRRFMKRRKVAMLMAVLMNASSLSGSYVSAASIEGMEVTAETAAEETAAFRTGDDSV